MGGKGDVKEHLLFRIARSQDLQKIEQMYRTVVMYMRQEHLEIWDDVYPLCCLADDIAKQQLYILEDRNDILSAIVIGEHGQGSDSIVWEVSGKALYIDRFAVHPHHQGKGIGKHMLRKAATVAENKGFCCLRLFVVDYNSPAISLYRRFGFVQREGFYDNVIDDTLTLRELGMEFEIFHRCS